MSMVFDTFGPWDVTEDGIICQTYDEYQVTNVFQTREVDGVKVWFWPIHLAAKPRFRGKNEHELRDFNQAFQYALIHWREQRPATTADVSMETTWKLQQEILDSDGAKWFWWVKSVSPGSPDSRSTLRYRGFCLVSTRFNDWMRSEGRK